MENEIGGLVDMVVGSNGGEIMITKPIIMKKILPFQKPDRKYHGAYKDMDVNFAIHGDGVCILRKKMNLLKFYLKGDQLPYEVIDFDEYLKRSFKTSYCLQTRNYAGSYRESKPLKMNVSM